MVAIDSIDFIDNFQYHFVSDQRESRNMDVIGSDCVYPDFYYAVLGVYAVNSK